MSRGRRLCCHESAGMCRWLHPLAKQPAMQLPNSGKGLYLPKVKQTTHSRKKKTASARSRTWNQGREEVAEFGMLRTLRLKTAGKQLQQVAPYLSTCLRIHLLRPAPLLCPLSTSHESCTCQDAYMCQLFATCSSPTCSRVMRLAMRMAL